MKFFNQHTQDLFFAIYGPYGPFLNLPFCRKLDTEHEPSQIYFHLNIHDVRNGRRGIFHVDATGWW